jgi:arginine/serine-rich splicing factor 4/5/6/arginine/serine-rich splicing factor 7
MALDTTRRELEDLFVKYGEIKRCEVKRGGYGFVEFYRRSEAERALSEDGTMLLGERIAVQFAKVLVCLLPFDLQLPRVMGF